MRSKKRILKIFVFKVKGLQNEMEFVAPSCYTDRAYSVLGFKHINTHTQLVFMCRFFNRE